MAEKKITGFKGFNKNMTCIDFQYEPEKDYKFQGKPILCENGSHFCENPFDVFGYYAPSDSRYCQVEALGETVKGDDKNVTSHIKIGVEIGLKGLIEAGVKFIFPNLNFK